VSRPLSFRRRGTVHPLLFLVLPIGFAVRPSPTMRTSSPRSSPTVGVCLWLSFQKPRPRVGPGCSRQSRWAARGASKRFFRTSSVPGESFARMMVTPLCGMALAALLYFGFRKKFGSQSEHEERHGRRTKGPELPCGLDEHPPCFSVAGLGDPSTADTAAAGVLGRNQSQIAYQHPWRIEAAEIAGGGHQSGGGDHAGARNAHESPFVVRVGVAGRNGPAEEGGAGPHRPKSAGKLTPRSKRSFYLACVGKLAARDRGCLLQAGCCCRSGRHFWVNGWRCLLVRA